MPDQLDAVMDAAFEALPSSTASSAASEGTPPTAPAKTETKSRPAAASGSDAAPTPPGKDGTATIAPTTSDGKSPESTDELTDAELSQKAIPVERVRASLRNAREKERVATEERIFTEVGYTRDEFKVLKPWIDLLARDGVSAYHAMGARLRQQGLLTDEPTSSPKPTAPPAERPRPDLRAEDGTFAYSDKAMEQLLAWERQQLLATVDERLKPHEATRAALERQTIDVQAKQYAQNVIADAQSWEGFEELRPQIAKAMEADGRVTIQSAYLKLHPAWRKEQDKKLESETRQRTLDEIAAKPKAPSREVRPSAAQVGTRGPTRGRSIDDIMEAAMSPLIS